MYEPQIEQVLLKLDWLKTRKRESERWFSLPAEKRADAACALLPPDCYDELIEEKQILLQFLVRRYTEGLSYDWGDTPPTLKINVTDTVSVDDWYTPSALSFMVSDETAVTDEYVAHKSIVPPAFRKVL